LTGTQLPEVQPFEESLMLREMTHRVNNELTSAISFVSLTASRSVHHEVKLALAGVMENLYNYARVYRALQMPVGNQFVDAAEYLRDLCRAISRSRLQFRGVELLLVLGDRQMFLREEQCWRLGMIVSELITNASRHAFGDRGGKIKVELLRRGSLMECSVADDGSGSDGSRAGRGLKIIQSLVRGLEGEVVQRFEARGTTAVLLFPADDDPVQSGLPSD
jgi:two-component sensor histidine kinase